MRGLGSLARSRILHKFALQSVVAHYERLFDEILVGAASAKVKAANPVPGLIRGDGYI